MNLDHLDATNKNTFLPISRTVKKVLILNNFMWLASFHAKLPAKFHEDWIRNLDPRILWVPRMKAPLE